MNTEPNKPVSKERSIARKLNAFFSAVPRKLPSFLLKNWLWKLLALFLAVCLWAGLITQDPTLTRERIFTDVNVSVNNASYLSRNNGLVVISGLEPENLKVRLRVDVPQREYNTASGSNYNPHVDLTRISEAGEQELRIVANSSTTYGTVRDVYPDTVTVVVDEYITNYRVPVQVNVIGEYPEGFYGSSVLVDPSVVAVSGPKTLVDQVSHIVVDFDVTKRTPREGEVRTSRAIRFLDAQDNEIPSAMLEASSANTVLRTAVLKQTIYPTRMLPINADSLVTGSPAKGYYVKNVSVSPAEVLAAGTTEGLNLVEELTAITPLSLEGLSASFSDTVRIRRPTSLTYLNADTVTVEVEIAPVQVSRSFDNVRLSARGTAAGLNVTSLSQKSVSLVLTGPQLMLEKLRSNQISAYVDVSGLAAGEHELPVMLHLEQTDMTGMTWLSTPSTVMVTLAEN